MARISRLVVPGHPHHVTQRGNRRLEVFFGDDDYRAYLALVAASCRAAGTAIWAYCLMPNHVHFILVPSHPDGLRAALGEAHRRYTRRINAREGWRGHLWQERFHSFVMDEAHLLACARYVERNPVDAGLVATPREWPWSSARAHLDGNDANDGANSGNGIVSVAPLLARMPDWGGFLAAGVSEAERQELRTHGNTGRPLGAADWVEALERRTGRPLRPRKPGRPRKAPAKAGK